MELLDGNKMEVGMTMDDRIERLEKKLVRGRRVNFCLMVVLGLAVLVWPLVVFRLEMNRGIRTRSIAAIDEKGKVRVMLAATKQEQGLNLYDEEGNIRITLAAMKRGPALILWDEKCNLRAMLAFNEKDPSLKDPSLNDEGPSLILSDEKGNSGASLFVLNDGPFLTLTDERAQGRVALMLDIEKDLGGLCLLDGNGNRRVRLTNYNQGNKGSALDLFDGTGNLSVTLSGTKEGTLLGLYGEAGKGGTVLGVFDKNRPELTLIDENGRAIWGAP